MAWSRLTPLRRPTVFLRRVRGAVRVALPRSAPLPVAIRCHGGCLVIEVLREIGPAAEPGLGRLLHAAIRPGGTAVLVDLRRAPRLGGGGLGLLCMARLLADRHGLAFALVGADEPPPVPLEPDRPRGEAVADRLSDRAPVPVGRGPAGRAL
ncbi:hypothetical protein PV682_38180 [Streptomyces niveiscabiei]|uniref:hypothetical protein n=1 Tax=Streptomyces niveiscabiei TaxID=164115 RepID=UPI0029B34B6C|nr:hypothetical protein [Streptomyces niveiscabiei]MDX3387231.1 hypothetical protein [Streptomyces niveiscabiei]